MVRVAHEFYKGEDIFLLSAKNSVDNEVNMGKMLITWIELNKRNHPNNGMVRHRAPAPHTNPTSSGFIN